MNISRVAGLASGLDTESMIKELMKAERKPLDNLMKKKQLAEWKREDYREINLLIASFRDNVMSTLRLESTFLTKKITSSNDSVVSARQKGNPGLQSYVIENVSLAKEGKPHAKDFQTTGTKSSEAFDLKITGYIGEKTIQVAKDESIDSIVSRINRVSAETGVVASYNKDDGKLVFTSTKVGKTDMKIDVGTNSLGLSSYDGTGTNAAGEPVTPGQVTINGVTLSINSNTFTYDGMEFTFKQPTASGQTYNISLTTNEDAIFDTVKKFVDEYNTLIDKLNKEISEARYRDYQPLTDEEKEALDEKVIEKWEEKAKSGLLRRDPIITEALSKMRQAIYSPVSGMNEKFDFLSEIGITTTKPGSEGSATNYLENGKLYIDETKLRKAISENPADVMALFTKSSTSTNDTAKFKESGIAERLYDVLGAVTSTLTDKAGMSGTPEQSETFSMGREMKDLNDQIERWERRLQDIENRYWKQFTALENAMNRFNSQSVWLTQQLGGGQM